MTNISQRSPAAREAAGWFTALNTTWHRVGVRVFLVVVIAHWAEHVVQAIQIWVFNLPRTRARGILGEPFPWLVSSEWLHYGYAIIMLIGLVLLRPGFEGKAAWWWNIAIAIQIWHFVEHSLLWIQAATGYNLFGKAVPTSFAQLIIPRVELHLFYNALVFLPIVMGLSAHHVPSAEDHRLMVCDCAKDHSTKDVVSR